MQEWYLGWEKVSCLERYPQFRSVLIERERERVSIFLISDLHSVYTVTRSLPLVPLVKPLLHPLHLLLLLLLLPPLLLLRPLLGVDQSSHMPRSSGAGRRAPCLVRKGLKIKWLLREREGEGGREGEREREIHTS